MKATRLSFTKIEPYRVPSSGHDGYDGIKVHFCIGPLSGVFEIDSGLSVEERHMMKWPDISMCEIEGIIMKDLKDLLSDL